MKTYAVKVGFMGDDRTKVLYHKYYKIEADSVEQAKTYVRNGLSIIEFRNFAIVEVKEIEC